MTRQIFILFFIAFSGCTQNADNHLKKEFYSDGKIKSEVPLINGKENGTMTVYQEDGNISANISMKEGLKDGYTYYYYPNGFLKAIGHYDLGIKNGDYFSFDEKGNIKRKTRYSKDWPEQYIEFDANGNVTNGASLMLIEIPEDTIKLGETYTANIKMNFVSGNWDCNVYLRTDSTKKDGEIFTRIGDCHKAVYAVTPNDLGEHVYKIASNQFTTDKNDKNDTISHQIKRVYNGKYWVEK